MYANRFYIGVVGSLLIVAWYWLFFGLATLTTSYESASIVVFLLYAGTSILVLVELFIAAKSFLAGQLGKKTLTAIVIASLLVLPQTVLQTFEPNSDPIGLVLLAWVGQGLFVFIALVSAVQIVYTRLRQKS